MILLKVSYRVRAHHIPAYEEVFTSHVMSLIQEYKFRFRGAWKTLVGDAGEYLELWEFDSVAQFESEWKKLMKDPRLLEIFQATGPMVEDENLSLLEPLEIGIEG